MESELSPLEEWKPTDISLLPQRKSSNRVCPECGSAYLADLNCESCGYQLSFDRLGDAFGDKSFYGLNERYLAGRPWLVKNFSFFSDVNSDSFSLFSKALVLRFNALLEAFKKGNWEKDDKKPELFFIELKDLSEELCNREGTNSLLLDRFYKQFNGLEETFFYSRIEKLLLRSNSKRMKSDKSFKLPFRHLGKFGIILFFFVLFSVKIYRSLI